MTRAGMIPPSADNIVLDTSALICLMKGEPGAAEVEEILRSRENSRSVYISFMSTMEIAYVLEMEQGEAAARRAVGLIKQLSVHVVESDEELGQAAARIKAGYRLSVADAWIAATAERLNATLVHKDPEFESLAKLIRTKCLPLKSGRG